MSLNIGGSTDAFYRYKMPDIEVKIEGRGNGIKTVIPNMADIGTAIKRDPAYPTKFFATELGALSKWDKERNVGIVNGEHSKEVLSKLLADFIKRYVLCPQCNLPETDLKVKDGKIVAKCKACGFRGPSDNKHKVATYIINHPPNKEDKDKKDKDDKDKKDKGDKDKGSKKSDKKKKDSPPQSPALTNGHTDRPAKPEAAPAANGGAENKEGEGEEDDGEIHFEITEEMLNMKVDEHAELDDPVELIAELLKSSASLPVDDQIQKIREHQKTHNFENDDMFQYVFKAIVTTSMAKQTKTHLALIKKLMTSGRESQRMLLSLIEQRCEEHPENLKDVSKTLMLLYESDLLEEEIILFWHEKGVSQLIALADQRASLETRKNADKFVEWLKNAEEEESDEE